MFYKLCRQTFVKNCEPKVCLSLTLIPKCFNDYRRQACKGAPLDTRSQQLWHLSCTSRQREMSVVRRRCRTQRTNTTTPHTIQKKRLETYIIRAWWWSKLKCTRLFRNTCQVCIALTNSFLGRQHPRTYTEPEATANPLLEDTKTCHDIYHRAYQ